MRNKLLKYTLLVAVIAFAGYKSVYFKKLSNIKQTAAGQFDAKSFAKKIWTDQLPAKLDSAIELAQLLDSIKTDPDAAFKKYSNAMAIGNYRYSLVKVTGMVTGVYEDYIELQITNGLSKINVATEFIYGNAIRDASKLFDVKDFTNSTDLSNISEALNGIVKQEILPSFKTAVKKGSKIAVIAAVEINMAHINLNNLELIPVQIKILP